MKKTAILLSFLMIHVNAQLSPLHRAIWAKDKSLVCRLIQEGASVNEKDDSGRTPIFFSIERTQTELTKILLENCANVHVCEKKSLETPLHKAVRLGLYEVSKSLLDYGANSDLKNIKGETALHIAASNGYYNCVKLLLKYGANPRVETKSKKITQKRSGWSIKKNTRKAELTDSFFLKSYKKRCAVRNFTKIREGFCHDTLKASRKAEKDYEILTKRKIKNKKYQNESKIKKYGSETPLSKAKEAKKKYVKKIREENFLRKAKIRKKVLNEKTRNEYLEEEYYKK